jgi:hypothetical protein
MWSGVVSARFASAAFLASGIAFLATTSRYIDVAFIIVVAITCWILDVHNRRLQRQIVHRGKVLEIGTNDAAREPDAPSNLGSFAAMEISKPFYGLTEPGKMNNYYSCMAWRCKIGERREGKLQDLPKHFASHALAIDFFVTCTIGYAVLRFTLPAEAPKDPNNYAEKHRAWILLAIAGAVLLYLAGVPTLVERCCPQWWSWCERCSSGCEGENEARATAPGTRVRPGPVVAAGTRPPNPVAATPSPPSSPGGVATGGVATGGSAPAAAISHTA